MSRLDELAELGEPRLRLMDEAGITTQVLSAAGPGADLLPQAVGPAFASELIRLKSAATVCPATTFTTVDRV